MKKTRAIRPQRPKKLYRERILKQGAPRTEVEDLPGGFRWSARAFGRGPGIFFGVLGLASVGFAAWLWRYPDANFVPLAIVFIGFALTSFASSLDALLNRDEVHLEMGRLKLSGSRFALFRWHKEMKLEDVEKIVRCSRLTTSSGWVDLDEGAAPMLDRQRKDAYLEIRSEKEAVKFGTYLSSEQLRYAYVYIGRQLKRHREDDN